MLEEINHVILNRSWGFHLISYTFGIQHAGCYMTTKVSSAFLSLFSKYAADRQLKKYALDLREDLWKTKEYDANINEMTATQMENQLRQALAVAGQFPSQIIFRRGSVLGLTSAGREYLKNLRAPTRIHKRA